MNKNVIIIDDCFLLLLLLFIIIIDGLFVIIDDCSFIIVDYLLFNKTKFSSSINKVIRSVLFFYDKISQALKSMKRNTRH